MESAKISGTMHFAKAKVSEKEKKKLLGTAKGTGTMHPFSYSTVVTAGTRYSTVKDFGKGRAIVREKKTIRTAGKRYSTVKKRKKR